MIVICLLSVVAITLICFKGNRIRAYLQQDRRWYNFPNNYNYLRTGIIAGITAGLAGKIAELSGMSGATLSATFVIVTLSSLAGIIVAIIKIVQDKNAPEYWSRFMFNVILYIIGLCGGILTSALPLWTSALVSIAAVIFITRCASFSGAVRAKGSMSRTV
ncbi:hypothetical protein LJC45_05855 [Alistipes sp. OttesenSCG-928-B03]|nr:hypothetical protein [Alistipes sp. OttesenSCG-928-B03]